MLSLKFKSKASKRGRVISRNRSLALSAITIGSLGLPYISSIALLGSIMNVLEVLVAKCIILCN